MTFGKIRESVLAGTWYPEHPETLRRDIRRYLDAAGSPHPGGRLTALVAPHAAYMYSGGVAAHAYKLLEGESWDTVMILAPSHRVPFDGASVYPSGSYATPLGDVPVDEEVAAALLRHSPPFKDLPRAHVQEHALEIQLPFLQVVLGRFRIVPVIMGSHTLAFCRDTARIIADVCHGQRILLVASTDLSHFHSYDEARRLDEMVVKRVEAFQAAELAEGFSKGDSEACGAGPLVTVMLAARELGANGAAVLRYANSGDVTGERHGGVVGYLAAALYCNPGTSKAHSAADGSRREVGVDLGLSSAEKETLRQIAQAAIRSRCLKTPAPATDSLPASELTPKLNELRGAFVCLKERDGHLRGCIGMIEGRTPLHQTIREMAVQAAFADPRFCPVEPGELDGLQLEISVLTPLERIRDAEDVHIGTHGLWLRNGLHSGLLLPQVAVEQEWNREQFLEWTCRKAGLPPQAWKDPETEIYVFSADIF